jgi:hypothetical protein
MDDRFRQRQSTKTVILSKAKDLMLPRLITQNNCHPERSHSVREANGFAVANPPAPLRMTGWWWFPKE